MRLGPILLTASLLGLAGCTESPAKLEQRPAEPATQPEPAPQPAPPVALAEAPKAKARVAFLSSNEAKAALERPLDLTSDPATADLVSRDGASNIAARCTPPGQKTLSNSRHGEAGPPPRVEEIDAYPLKVGLIPTSMPPALVNELTLKTRIWQTESAGFDFYRILSDDQPGGLRLDKPWVGCIRYSMIEDGGKLHSDMLFSVAFTPKTPEVIRVAPIRVYYRDFPSLSANSGSREVAVKIGLNLKTFSLERTAGRASVSLQNQEMAVEIFTDPGPGKAVYQLYDPLTGPSHMVPLPPWDYSSTSENPRHNLAVLGLTATEIADFDWLQSHVHALWPSWEYEATDVAKIKLAARFYSRTHMSP